uniref:Uncharacterized protein n=1 Tax=Anguilla anguilla TaxID=7936 RepID=A0A0E9W257_ANGAN
MKTICNVTEPSARQVEIYLL